MKTESPPPTTTIPTLLHSLRDDTTALLQQQISLAKAEINESTVELAKRIVAIAIGGAIVFAGLLLILFAAGDLAAAGLVEAGLEITIAVWLGPLLMGILIAIIGWGMFAKARKELTTKNFAPTETIESLKDNKNWAKEKIES